MKNIKILVPALLISLLAASCSDYVTQVDPLIDQVESGKLNKESEVPFLIKGVQTKFAQAIDQIEVNAECLSDAFDFNLAVPGATYPQFDEINSGYIPLSNTNVSAAFDPLGELRYLADDLIERADKYIVFADTTVKKEALFTGYFYGGIARYLYASYFGLTPAQGGGVINNSAFIPSDNMYSLAAEYLAKALKNTSNETAARTVNSLLAKIWLYKGDYTQARSFALKGMSNIH